MVHSVEHAPAPSQQVLYDRVCRQIIDQAPGAAVAWYLMAAYLYYHEDVVIISDGMFEHLSAFLAAHWTAINHPHKALLSLEDLTTGSAYAIAREAYPAVVVSAAHRILREGVQLPAPASAPTGQLQLF
ncbi:MAG: hypothetical protein F8N36_14320 [Desulfovibrio sp.]|uniref:hypothetical protein n=1 Tax=Desulfovibrio sp. TaxID=885 RepID=UPI00135D27F9|nr:hypothetical protein [Desulfovibrio sp.]MTJ94013.1 hypothetical protein [Desulfovibrio sp.]